MNLIELQKVCKVYNKGRANEVRALSDVDLTIEAGDSLAVMGVSGSGKSTLLNILGCIDAPTTGKYLYDGKPVDELSDGGRAALRSSAIGFVLQNYGLLPDDKVWENIALPMLLAGKRRKVIKQRIRELLATVGLEDKYNERVRELSGGQVQRVAIARAMANRPRVLLADEPTGALDYKTACGILELLMQLNAEGMTVVMVTHDSRMAEYMARTVTLSDGRLA